MGLNYIRQLFENGSVCVTGMKGSGKDMLIANVVARRGNKPYCSNIDYKVKGEFIPLELAKFDVGGNTYRNFINGDIMPYNSPIGENIPIFISDVGVYLPSQYCNELNREYKFFPTFFALSRQLNGEGCKVHINTQNLGRCWDKLREFSDRYLFCRWCKVLFGGKLVIQLVTEYDKAESCQARINPCAITSSIFDDRNTKRQVDMYLDNFYNAHGLVRNHLLIYVNKANYNTRAFRDMMEVSYPNEDLAEDSTCN